MAVNEFLMHKNGTCLRIQWQLLAFYGEDTVNLHIVCHRVRKVRDSGRDLDVNDQLCSGRPVTTAHNGNRQKWAYFSEHKL